MDQVWPGAGAASKVGGNETYAFPSDTSPWQTPQLAARGVPMRIESRRSLPSASSRSGRMSSLPPSTWHWTHVAADFGGR